MFVAGTAAPLLFEPLRRSAGAAGKPAARTISPELNVRTAGEDENTVRGRWIANAKRILR
jgi:hypothetical protein